MQVDEEELFTVRLKKPPFKEKPCKVVSLQFPSYENMHLSTHIYASETIILKSSLHESMNWLSKLIETWAKCNGSFHRLGSIFTRCWLINQYDQPRWKKKHKDYVANGSWKANYWATQYYSQSHATLLPSSSSLNQMQAFWLNRIKLSSMTNYFCKNFKIYIGYALNCMRVSYPLSFNLKFKIYF